MKLFFIVMMTFFFFSTTLVTPALAWCPSAPPPPLPPEPPEDPGPPPPNDTVPPPVPPKDTPPDKEPPKDTPPPENPRGGGGDTPPPGGPGGGDPAQPVGTKVAEGAKKKGGGPASASLDHWNLWWEANKSAYLTSTLVGEGLQEGFLGGEGQSAVVYKPKVSEELFQLLLEALRSKDRNLRMVAAIAMGRIGDPSFLNHLEQRLQEDSAEPVRQSLMMALGLAKHSRGVSSLLRVIENRALTDMDRGFALMALGFIGTKDVLPGLAKLMEHESSSTDLQASIVTAVGFIGDSRSVRFLSNIVSKESYDPLVRAYACAGLARLKDSESIEALLVAYKSRKAEVRQAALLALGEVPNGEAKQTKLRNMTLIKALKTEKDAQALGFLCITLGKLGDPGASFSLSQFLKKAKQPNSRGFAALGLGLLGDDLAKSVLKEAFLAEKNISNRGAYLIGMGLARDLQAIPLIFRALQEEGDREFKGYAVTALGLLRNLPQPAKEGIYQLLKQNTRFSRLIGSCATALSMAGDPRGSEYLKELLAHPNALVSSNAALSLGELNGTSVVPVLVKAYQKSTMDLSKQFYLIALGKAFENERRKISLLRWFSLNYNYRARTLTYEHVLKIP
jgi:HEAT repeat protein